MRPLLAAMGYILVACAGESRPPPAPVEPVPEAPAPAVSSAVRRFPAPDAATTECGAHRCRTFASPRAAFEYVLERRPLVLAIGESHAQQGAAAVESTTARFTRDLLPMLQGRTEGLVVELMLPNPDCQREVEEVKEEQKVVTEKQAPKTQNEFVVLGRTAQALGITPFPLRPSCEDLQRIAEAGDDAVLEMLSTITRLTKVLAARLMNRTERRGREMVTLYGGALHNDLVPREGREQWSFGPELSDATGGRYVELDLVVREFVQDSEGWRAQPWYGAYEPDAHPDETLLLEPYRNSFALVFPRSAGVTPDRRE